MFYNTGIPTYIFLITNRKSKQRKGKVQLINATSEKFYNKMRKPSGKNELSF
jgi:type I restriction enzyme M protein